MTYEDWQSAIHPGPILEFLQNADKGSERKLRLFACACCRRIWPIVESWYHRLGEVTESYADGLASGAELKAAADAAYDPDWTAGHAFETAGSLDGEIADVASEAAEYAANAAANYATNYRADDQDDSDWLKAYAVERLHQTDLLRCIFGDPFRPITIDASLLTDSVRRIATAIYEERSFEKMGILADALEECGVADAALLGHCRSGGPHARGCYVLDLILGKG